MGSQLQLLRLPYSLQSAEGLGPKVTYPATAAAVVVAGGLSLVLYPRLLTSPLAPFTFAVIFAAWLGGLGPSLLATALSIGAVVFLPYPPGTFTASASRLVVFSIVCL